MLYADSLRTFAVALIVPNEANLTAWAQETGLEAGSFADLCNNEAAGAEVLRAVVQVQVLRFLNAHLT